MKKVHNLGAQITTGILTLGMIKFWMNWTNWEYVWHENVWNLTSQLFWQGFLSLKLDMTIKGFYCLFVEWRALPPSAKNRHFSMVTMTIPEPFRGNNMAMRCVDLQRRLIPGYQNHQPLFLSLVVCASRSAESSEDSSCKYLKERNIPNSFKLNWKTKWVFKNEFCDTFFFKY